MIEAGPAEGPALMLSDETFRNGEQGALALDVIALLDALEIESAILAGFDWEARTADIVAAVWLERCSGLVSVSGYLIVNLEEAPDAFADAILEVGGAT